MPWRGPQYEGEFPSLGHQLVPYFEHYLCHGPGDVVGEPIEVDDEFYEFIVRAYRIDPETGRRVVPRAFLSRPKGRAKSELAGMLTVGEGIFPVRFDGWDAAGEPVGRPVTSPFIRCLATEEGQSGNTYDNVAVMLQHLVEHHGDAYPGIDFGRSAETSTRVLLRAQRGEIIPSTAANAGKDGGKETFAVFDETHLYVLPELHRMHRTVRRNLRKRRAAQPWSLETSTMYRRGEDSVAEQTHAQAQAIAEGKRKPGGLLFDHRQAPDGIDLGDYDSLVSGLRAAYGPAAEWMDLDGIIRDEIWDAQADPGDSRRYWLNQASSAEDAWIADHLWRPAADPTNTLADGDVVTLGLDGSVRDDSTVLAVCRVADGHVELLGAWERPDGPEAKDWQVPRPAVHAAVDAAMTRFRVVGFYADPPHWQDSIDAWTSRYGARLLAKASRTHPIEWWTQRQRAAVATLERFREAVVTGQLTHDGGDVLTRHVLNARRRVSSAGLTIAKEHPKSPRKIDAAWAAVLAYEARADAVALGLDRRMNRRAGRRASAHGF